MELLRDYAHGGSEAAFSILVARYVNLVYSAALRTARCPEDAQEITQVVFIILAQKAGRLRPNTVLSGWLYQTARLTAVNLLRRDIRRERREQEATMQPLENDTVVESWPQLYPILEDAMGELSEKDRNAIVLRFFEGKSFREVSIRLGGSENAAKKRVAHVLERLRKAFLKRGVASTAALLGEMLSAHAVEPAPTALAQSITITALAKSAPVSGSTLTLAKGTLKRMAWAKAKTATIASGKALLAATTLFTIWYLLSGPQSGLLGGPVTVGVAAGGPGTPGANLWVLKPDGSLWGMGDNWPSGPIGDGTAEPQPRLVRIGADRDWKDVAAGANYVIGLKRDGTLWTWGNNGYGQLGDGNTQTRNRPARIGTDHDWVRIAAGGFHALALKSDGTLWAWGANRAGQLGIGSTVDQHTPVQVGHDRDWKVISGGLVHTLALKTNGTLWAWGQNGNGTLGDGDAGTQKHFDSANRSSPVQIGSEMDWVAVSAGHNHSLALKANCTLWAWGAGFNGQLGNGTTGRSFTPEQVGQAAGWKLVGAGGSHTIALNTDGSLWTWGANFDGQIGNGITVDQLVPVRIGSAKDWVRAWAGVNYTVGLKTDGSLWIWGARLIQRETGPWVRVKGVMRRFGIPINAKTQTTMDLIPVKLTELGALPP